MWVKVDGYNVMAVVCLVGAAPTAQWMRFSIPVGSMVKVGSAALSVLFREFWHRCVATRCLDVGCSRKQIPCFSRRVQQPQPTPVDYAYSAQAVHTTSLAIGGIAALSSTYTHNGLIDEFVLLDYAADPKTHSCNLRK